MKGKEKLCFTRKFRAKSMIKRGQNIVLLQMVPDMFANYVLQDLARDTFRPFNKLKTPFSFITIVSMEG